MGARRHPNPPTEPSVLSISKKKDKDKAKEQLGASGVKNRSNCQEPFSADVCLDVSLSSCPHLNIVI